MATSSTHPAPRASSTAVRTKRAVRTVPPRTAGRRTSSSLPGWSQERRRQRWMRPLTPVRTARLMLGILLVGTIVVLFVSHTLETERLLAQVEAARKENVRLHLQHDRLAGEFDRRTAPEVIHTRAAALGLVDVPAYGPPLRIDDDR